MKTTVTTLLVVCVAIIAGAIVYLDYQKTEKAPAPVAAAPAGQTGQISPAPSPATQPRPVIAQTAPAQTPAPAPVANPASAPETISPVHKLVLALLSAKNQNDKQAAFDELRKNGELEAAIADLKQEAADNPNDPEIPTTLGEAELNQLRTLVDNGGLTANHDQIGILAMQADQEFDAALQIDPKNWEAQYVKAASMYYWPSSPQTDNDVVQRLTSLIDQQDTMSANPAFAQSYLTLGNEYQKLGQTDKAMATWQLGAQEYPSDASLQKKIAGGAVQ